MSIKQELDQLEAVLGEDGIMQAMDNEVSRLMAREGLSKSDPVVQAGLKRLQADLLDELDDLVAAGIFTEDEADEMRRIHQSK